ncbi:MAG: 5-(carboxyamino)imidazole ribonucleotide synthase [Gammaproteobacteria bacterium]|nr:5-(carboxyamino)imidazole ribonucleotide synthase [Gammaproteobacteria bacterium]MDJ0870369.1 5-(carboxyamino)imidazole ribonucleotide synthase [Gammaproteobacteria bacterium]
MKDTFPCPVARIGLIGGGQLGRMTVKAARRLGCTCVVLDPLQGSPAGQVAGHQIVGDYSDPAMLRELAKSCDLITFELENIETETLIRLEAEGHRIYPRPELLANIQDKYRQKRLLREAGIPTSDFMDMPKPDADVFDSFGYPLVQKARRGGYDGRGVIVMSDARAFAGHLSVPSYVERFVEAEKELAVIVARNAGGECRVYPTVEMRFHPQQNLLDFLVAPAGVPPEVARHAEDLAVRTVEAMDGVGVFGIEMFLSSDGQLLVNEVAPRTHNSGHHTIEACVTDQFEQHLRAILGLPLGETRQLSPATMVNLLGEPGYQGRPLISGLAAVLAIPGVCLHIYGKAVTKPGRKMGHVTVIDETLEGACEKASVVKKSIKILGDEKL